MGIHMQMHCMMYVYMYSTSPLHTHIGAVVHCRDWCMLKCLAADIHHPRPKSNLGINSVPFLVIFGLQVLIWNLFCTDLYMPAWLS